MQSCFPQMDGQECDSYFKTQKDLHRGVTIIPSTCCHTCAGDNCNKRQDKPSHGNSLKVISSLLLFCMSGLIYRI